MFCVVVIYYVGVKYKLARIFTGDVYVKMTLAILLTAFASVGSIARIMKKHFLKIQNQSIGSGGFKRKCGRPSARGHWPSYFIFPNLFCTCNISQFLNSLINRFYIQIFAKIFAEHSIFIKDLLWKLTFWFIRALNHNNTEHSTRTSLLNCISLKMIGESPKLRTIVVTWNCIGNFY